MVCWWGAAVRRHLDAQWWLPEQFSLQCLLTVGDNAGLRNGDLLCLSLLKHVRTPPPTTPHSPLTTHHSPSCLTLLSYRLRIVPLSHPSYALIMSVNATFHCLLPSVCSPSRCPVAVDASACVWCKLPSLLLCVFLILWNVSWVVSRFPGLALWPLLHPLRSTHSLAAMARARSGTSTHCTRPHHTTPHHTTPHHTTPHRTTPHHTTSHHTTPYHTTSHHTTPHHTPPHHTTPHHRTPRHTTPQRRVCAVTFSIIFGLPCRAVPCVCVLRESQSVLITRIISVRYGCHALTRMCSVCAPTSCVCARACVRACVYLCLCAYVCA